jgi:hypothetical protein
VIEKVKRWRREKGRGAKSLAGPHEPCHCGGSCDRCKNDDYYRQVSEMLRALDARQTALLTEIESSKGLHYCGKSLQGITGEYFSSAELEAQIAQAQKELEAVAAERSRILTTYCGLRPGSDLCQGQ